MPADYRLLPEIGLTYVKFSGHVSMDEVVACLEEFAAEPNNRSILRHLVDFSDVTSFDSNYVRIIETQAKMAGVFVNDMAQWIFAYYAPTKISREMASYGVRAWNDVPNVVLRMTESETATMDVFGLPQRTLAELLDGVTPF